MNSILIQDIQESAQFLRERLPQIPEIAIVLGTGMGDLIERVTIIKEISYKNIPHLVPTTVESHSGKLILAHWADHYILIMSGRLHYYEGYTAQEVTYPIRILKALGIKTVWFTNASGTVNPKFNAGDIVFIDDHINFHPENPLRGIDDARLGLRFPDMSEVYSTEQLMKAKTCCESLNIPFHRGIYFGLQGPSLETPAEYRMIHLLGADIVGMSTVPEVIVAHQCELNILAVSIVSNSTPQVGANQKTTIELVIATINNYSKKLFDIFDMTIKYK